MKTLWITYSWEDNKTGDIEFIAQELERAGIAVKLDRWNIEAGKRLWEQIDKFITNETECDAWAIIATENSLGSEPCKEEIAYALQRSLNSRGQTFPILGIFISTIDQKIIPSAIKTRLYVSLKDDNWIERIKAAVEDRSPKIPRTIIEPYSIEIRKSDYGKNVFEIRPRAGTWAPFVCAIPLLEKDKVKPSIMRGPKGNIPKGGMLTMCGDVEIDDGEWWLMFAGDEATPSMSYFLFCTEIPSKIGFGVHNSEPQYCVSFEII